MRKHTSLVLVLLALLLFGAPVVAKDKKDQNKGAGSEWEIVFQFPQKNQKGKLLVLNEETFADPKYVPKNIREEEGFAASFAQIRVATLASELYGGGKAFSKFEVYRKRADHSEVSINAEVVENPPEVPAGPTMSKKRRIFSSLLMAGPMGLSLVNPVLAGPAFLISGIVGTLTASGGGNMSDLYVIDGKVVKKQKPAKGKTIGFGGFADAYNNSR